MTVTSISTHSIAKKKRRQVVCLPKKNIIKGLISKLKRFHKSKYFKPIIFVITVVSLFIISILIFNSNDILAISKVHCYIEEQQCPPQYQNLLTNVTGSNILKFDSNQFERNIVNLNPLVQQVHISKYIPSTITFTFVLRTPVAVIIDRNNRGTFIDRSGKIYAEGYRSEMSHIYFNESVSVGEDAASPQLLAALKIINAMDDSFIPVKYIDARILGSFTTQLHTGQTIIFDGQKPILSQVDALQVILQNSKIVSQEKPIKSIDLRFENPIVR